MSIAFVFDTETTALYELRKKNGKIYKRWGNAVQIAWILYNIETNKILAIENHIIKLKNDALIPPSSTEIHKITNEIMNEKGEQISDVLDIFNIHISKADIVIAHNLDFDKNIITQEYSDNGYINIFNTLSCSYYCTMKDIGNFCGLTYTNKFTGEKKDKWPSQEELHYKLFETKLINLHNALNDVLVCFRCYYKLMFDEDILQKNKKIKKLFTKQLIN